MFLVYVKDLPKVMDNFSLDNYVDDFKVTMKV